MAPAVNGNNRRASATAAEEDEDYGVADRRGMSSSSSEEEEEEGSRIFDGYSISADVSESDDGSSCRCCSSTYSAAGSDDRDWGSSVCCDLPGAEAAERSVPTVMFPVVGDRHVFIPAEKRDKPEITELEVMKQRFAKLLLGEDMSGGGNGVCPALAISNAITNLAASVFGELWKLEPLSPPRKSIWMREMEVLLCVCDSIVELVPSVQEIPGTDGKTTEIMVPQPRADLSLNLPVLKKLDAMLISILDGFRNSEFFYIEKRHCHEYQPSQGRTSVRLEEKWWLPFPKVPKNGLSPMARGQLQQCWKCTDNIYKAALAINNGVLSDMQVPKVYLDCLPKNWITNGPVCREPKMASCWTNFGLSTGGKACLGEPLYRYLTADQLPTEGLVEYLDQMTENSTLEIANKLEAALYFWRQKYCKKKDSNDNKTAKLTWSASLKGLVDSDKSKVAARRAETLLKDLKVHFPSLPQTALEMTKIQYNKDVGQAILESYSRVMESLAFNLMARIEDLLYIDDATRLRAAEESMFINSHDLQNRVHALGPRELSRRRSIFQTAISAEETAAKLERLAF